MRVMGSGLLYARLDIKGIRRVRRTVIYGERCLQLFLLAPAQVMSPSLKADGKYYDADSEGEGK